MIEYKKGNIFKEEVEAIVNAVNCVGVMGRGIALQFKRAFPTNFKEYAVLCKQKEIQPGCMFIFELDDRDDSLKYIVNFPTKRHWKDKSRIEDIELGLNSLAEEIRIRDIKSIAIPPLGCGLGGLLWPDVRSCMEDKLKDFVETRIVILEP